MERIGPRIIRGAIEDIYKTPFRLLRNIGSQKLAQVKRKLKSIMKRSKTKLLANSYQRKRPPKSIKSITNVIQEMLMALGD